ncbi:MAG: ferritin [Acidobacteriota bacterium]
MLVTKKLVKAFNQQIGHEMGASLQYIAISAYFGSEGLPELQKHFDKQAMEERVHAMKFVKFLVDAGGRVEIPAIPAPQSSFKTAEDAVALSLKWEETVTQQIYGLVDAAKVDKNYIAIRFLDWFVTEQLEEVSSMSQLLSIVQRSGNGNLLFVEDYLARRVSEGEAGAQ